MKKSFGIRGFHNQGSLNLSGRTYTYDSANRLVSYTIGDPQGTTFAYKGLSDRLTQTVGGQETTYTLDLAAGLTQVLNDETHTYLYGNTRLAQVPTSSENSYAYFLLATCDRHNHNPGNIKTTP